MPAIESVTGNVETFESFKDDQKEYQTLQSVVAESEYVLDEREESASDDAVMDEPDEFPVGLVTGTKEHRVVTDSSMEESELGEIDFFSIFVCLILYGGNYI